MNISCGDMLGSGSFATVRKMFVGGKPCALKVAKDSEEERAALLNEDIILRYLHRDEDAATSHIIKRFSIDRVGPGSETIGLVLELLGVDLGKYCAVQGRGLSLEKTRQITAQLAKALSFLRENRVIHGDIKPENILMSTDGASVTLADFGHSSFSEPAHNPPDRFRQALGYRSPEVVLRITATEAADVWSLAATIAEIYSRKMIFEAYNEPQLVAYHRFRLGSSYSANLVAKAAVSGRRTFDRSSSIKGDGLFSLSQLIRTASALKEEDSEPLMDLLNQMFVYDPGERAIPKKILNHPFLLQGKTMDPPEEEPFDYW